MIRVLFNHILPFVLGGIVGVGAVYLVMPAADQSPNYCRARKAQLVAGSSTFEPDNGVFTPIVVTSKPLAMYTETARRNNVEGSVLLKVTLLANGEVGSVRVVRGLPDGLTERAVDAARRIEFEPKRVDGVPVSVTQTFEYTFSIY